MRLWRVVVKILKMGSFQSNNAPRPVSDKFKVLTDKGVISSAIVSSAIAGIGLIFFALFIWKRKTLNPPSYMDIEKARKLDEKGLGENSPQLPIQPASRTPPSPEERDNPFADFGQYGHYRELLAGRTRGHSRSRSNASSMTANGSAYDLYRETLLKRALLTNSVFSMNSTYRDSVSDYGSDDLGYTGPRGGKPVDSVSSSVYSDGSHYSQMSGRIVVNSVRMPPQFATPTRPPSVVS